MKYEEASTYFQNDRIRELSLSEQGRRFLKIRSLSRKEQMQYVIDEYRINIGNSTSHEWAKKIYEADVSTGAIDKSIHRLYEVERSKRRETEEQLIRELYKVQTFEWGGLHQNNLEKTIVNNYVKKIDSYDRLEDAIENDIHISMRAYVLASWYNHWSSIVIEDIFKDHSKVIPAVGLIKKIDFFVDDKPFDLKVTYLPEGFVKDRRKSQGLEPEATLMKRVCRGLKIEFERSLPESVLIPDLWQKFDDHPDAIAYEKIGELLKFRDLVLDEARRQPATLIRWLYENQGVRRFDASNRLFLILADKNNFFDSWKLKRAKPLMEKEINSYLDRVGGFGRELDFEWGGNKHTTESDAIFVVKERRGQH